MKKNYFWDTKISNKNVKKILKDEFHPKFISFAALLLSRTNETHKVFAEYLDKIIFCRYWRKIKNKMRKNKWNDTRIIFWEEVYGVLLQKIDIKKVKRAGEKRLPVSEELVQFCNIIRRRRKKIGWTQKELAKKTHLSQQTISFIENGYLNFSFKTLMKIAEVLDLKINIRPKDSQILEDEETKTVVDSSGMSLQG
ncbi:MAG: helix-turn-helix transcriptional regulator [Candidatus Omnitrophica bacterium]|nr:helix-turn-helix transcriptional regulator [Candidatus Omnitrophota bacterium]